MKKKRIVSQFITFILFGSGILFSGTTYWPLPEEVFFRLDPLITIVISASSGILIAGVVLSGLMVILTVIFGRFFCSWICPLGTLIDFTEWMFQKSAGKVKMKSMPLPTGPIHIKYGILIVVLTASVFSIQWIYFFDPILIMTRFLGMILNPIKQSLFPATPFTVTQGYQFIIYGLLILGLSTIASRCWCRYICPLGALFGLFGRYPLFDFSQENCKDCPRCAQACPTRAIISSDIKNYSPQECIRCFDCQDSCQRDARVFKPQNLSTTRRRSFGIKRRTFFFWLTSGMSLSAILKMPLNNQAIAKTVIRPPFSADEDRFLDLCIRCQACVNVCPTNTLQPLLLNTGFHGLWSPALVPAIGGCETDCNRCSEVCPTQAIGRFDRSNKYTLKMGTVHFLQHRCIPYIQDKSCGKCIPKCPTGAISYLEQGKRQLPVEIDFLLCVGCGICENVCTRQTLGKSALITSSHGRNQTSGVDVMQLLKSEPVKGQ